MASLLSQLKQSTMFIVMICGGSLAGAQQPSQAQIEALATRMLTAMASDDARLELAVSNVYGRELASDKRIVVKTMLRSVLNNKRMPHHLAKVIVPTAGITFTPKQEHAYVATGMATLAMQGLRRLGTERKAQYVQDLIDMASAIPPRDCKALFLGRLDPRTAALTETRRIASLPIKEFEASVSLYRASIEAELAEYPNVKTINPTESKSAESAHEMALDSRMRRLPAGLSDRVLRDADGAEPAEVCQFFRESTAAALDLSEPQRGWYLTRFIEQFQ